MGLFISENQAEQLIIRAVKRALGDINKPIERVPIAIVDPNNSEACVNAYAVVCVGNTATTVQRVELWDGTVINDYEPTEPTCDCTDLPSES